MANTGLSELDSRVGGLEDGRDYLAYGKVGTGKSSFGIGFLAEGLRSGERVALITRRPPDLVIDHARALGFDFESPIRGDRLIVFEYVEGVFENANALRDHPQIVKEFEPVLKQAGARRVVIDPVIPLLATATPSAATFRGRALLQSLASLRSTNLCIIDLPEGAASVDSCQELFHGLLRFEAGMDVDSAPTIHVERSSSPLWKAGRHSVFELSAYRRRDGEARTTNGRILLVDSGDDRERLREILSQDYDVTVATDIVDVMPMVTTHPPDLAIIDKEVSHNRGLELCRALRKSRTGLPILVVGRYVRRVRDRVEILASGADTYLERPLDGRLLALEISGLLKRGSRSAQPVPTATVLEALKRNSPADADSVESFSARILREIEYSKGHGLALVVLAIELPGTDEVPSEMTAVCHSLIREYDVAFKSPGKVFILLAEAGEQAVASFRKAFSRLWTGGEPVISHRCYDGSAQSLHNLEAFLEEELHGAFFAPIPGPR